MNKIEWHLRKVLISELKPYSLNPRNITESGLQDLSTSIDKFGMPEKIVCNLDNTIIGGHARLIHLKKKGEIETEASFPSRMLTDEEVKELNIRLNKNIAGEWDYSILTNHFSQEDLLGWGFNEYELLGAGFDLGNDDLLDYKKEYENMPEFFQEDISGRKLIVHFDSDNNVKKFAELIGQNITAKTRSIWFPFKEREKYAKLQ